MESVNMFEIRYQTHNEFWNTLFIEKEEESCSVYEGLKRLNHVTYIEIKETVLSDKSQEHYLNEILKLKKINPEMEIHFCVDSETVYEFGWTYHEITRVDICPWYEDDEYIHVYKWSIENRIKEKEFDSEEYDNIPDSELNRMVEEIYDKIVKQAICVFTHARQGDK
jgi:hypothetical protein